MTRKLLGFALLLAGGLLATACVTTERVYVQPTPKPAPEAAPPQETASYSGAEDEPFYEDLAPYGNWAYVSGPGWVWYPYRVPAGWRPYSYGHWVFTDYGWTWASEESFGWAVYHYGRWYDDPDYGWVWVPGTEWGPAWVAWHEGGGYVGWAPLPWQVTWRAGFGLDWGGVSINVALGPSAWYFVRDRDMVAPNLRGCFLPASRNVTLIQNTVHVTNYVIVENRIVDRGVRREKIGRAVGHTIPSYRVRRSESPEDSRGRVQGQEFVVLRRDPARGHGPQRRDVPSGHDGSRPRDEGRGDRTGDRGPNRREIPPGHDAYPPSDEVNPGSHEGQGGRGSMQQGDRDSGTPSQREDASRGEDQNRPAANGHERHDTDGSADRSPQEGRGSEAGSGPGQHGPRPSRMTNPDNNHGRGQGQRPQAEGSDAHGKADGAGAPAGEKTHAPQGGPGEGNGAGSVNAPPSAQAPGQAKPGNAASHPTAKGKGKAKGKKPAPEDKKPDDKPEEAPKDGSGSGS